MSWSWSHTVEAYEAARYRLGVLPKGTLNIIWAEWKTHQHSKDNEDDPEVFNQEVYKAALKEARGIDAQSLADQVWEWAEEYSTCSNGGYELYMCPYDCHEVSPDELTVQQKVRGGLL